MTQPVRYNISEWRSEVESTARDLINAFEDAGQDAQADAKRLAENATAVAKEFANGDLSATDAAFRYEQIARTARARLQTLQYKAQSEAREFALKMLDHLFRVVTILV